MKTDKKHDVLLLVCVPSLQDLIRIQLEGGFDENMCLLETYAFLQQSLSGCWEIDSFGSSKRKVLEPEVLTTVGQTLWIDLGSISPGDIKRIRTHYQHIKDSEEPTVTGRPIATFGLTGDYPADSPFSKFEIGAVKVDGKFFPTYIFC